MNAETIQAESHCETSQVPGHNMPMPSRAAVPCENPLPPYTAIIDGRRLRQLRRQHGLSQETLAHQARIGRTTLARLESQPRPRCRTYTLAQLAAVLQEDPETIALLVRTTKTSPARPGRAAITPSAH
jgi:DNA-binding XRE family transcriptional regulator